MSVQKTGKTQFGTIIITALAVGIGVFGGRYAVDWGLDWNNHRSFVNAMRAECLTAIRAGAPAREDMPVFCDCVADHVGDNVSPQRLRELEELPPELGERRGMELGLAARAACREDLLDKAFGD